MKFADIQRMKPGARRDEAERIYSETRKANVTDGDGSWAGGAYDPEGYRSRQDRAHALASAAVDRFLAGGTAPASADRTKSGLIDPDEAARNSALVASLGITYGAAAPATATIHHPEEEPDAFDWDDILPPAKTPTTRKS